MTETVAGQTVSNASTSSDGSRPAVACNPDELRTLFLFEKLTDDQFDWLCRMGHVEEIPAGPACGKPSTQR